MIRTRIVAFGVLVLLVSLAGVAPPAKAGIIKVLAYGDSSSVGDQGKAITNASNGTTTFSVTTTSSTGSITTANLANYDVFYAGSSFGNNLDGLSAVLQNYLSTRGGIVVGQPNVSGPISWLPGSLSVNVSSISYHSSGTHSLTAAGSASPIFTGLTASSLAGPPADSIYSSGLGAGWTILANHTQGSDVHVNMAAGSFGSHRVLLWPGRFDSNIFANPGPTLIRQAFEWTAGAATQPPAVPEPASLVSCLVGAALFGAGAIRRRLRRGG